MAEKNRFQKDRNTNLAAQGQATAPYRSQKKGRRRFAIEVKYLLFKDAEWHVHSRYRSKESRDQAFSDLVGKNAQHAKYRLPLKEAS